MIRSFSGIKLQNCYRGVLKIVRFLETELYLEIKTSTNLYFKNSRNKTLVNFQLQMKFVTLYQRNNKEISKL